MGSASETGLHGLLQIWVAAWGIVYPALTVPVDFLALAFSILRTKVLILLILLMRMQQDLRKAKGLGGFESNPSLGVFVKLTLTISCFHGCRSFIFRLFAKRKERKTPKKPVLELVEGIFNPPGDSYSRLNESQRLPSSSSYNSRDIPLQCLDARALMARTATSTPASSLDLEWEHEALPLSISHEPSASSWAMFPEETLEACPTESSTHHAHGSNSDWSRVSSADSLEWDNVQNSFHASPPISDVDTDTQLLLSEIERLTSEALKETGQNLIS